MRNIVVELLKALKEESIICCPCLPGMDAQKLRKISWAFVQEAWRYPFVILGKNNVHMKKVYGNLKLSKTRLWVLVVNGHEAFNL